ncbi:MAG: hypothetical protein ACE14S_09250 [Candidatus Bathyarchaeia archaeon]
MLEKVLKKLEIIDAKLNSMPQVQVQTSSRLLPTLSALQRIGSGTASQVCKITGRSRAHESKNLNEMHALSLVSKQVRGHAKIFTAKDTAFANFTAEALSGESGAERLM